MSPSAELAAAEPAAADAAMTNNAAEPETTVADDLVATVATAAEKRLCELSERRERLLRELYARKQAGAAQHVAAIPTAPLDADAGFCAFAKSREEELADSNKPPEKSVMADESSNGATAPRRPAIRFQPLERADPTRQFRGCSGDDPAELVDFATISCPLTNSILAQPPQQDSDISGYGHYAYKLKTDQIPLHGMFETPAKALGSREWGHSYEEGRQRQLFASLEALQAQGLSSLHQYRRFTAPPRRRAHWDYLLTEMKWLQADFREERKWHLNVAFQLARACAEAVGAPGGPFQRQRVVDNVNKKVALVLDTRLSTYQIALPTPAATPGTEPETLPEELEMPEEPITFQFASPSGEMVVDALRVVPITRTLQTPFAWSLPLPKLFQAEGRNPPVRTEASCALLANTRLRQRSTVILPFEQHDGFVKETKREKVVPEPYVPRASGVLGGGSASGAGAPAVAAPAGLSGSDSAATVIVMPVWTAQEDNLLRILVRHYGFCWSFVSDALWQFNLRGGDAQPFQWSPWQCYQRHVTLQQAAKAAASSSAPSPAGPDAAAVSVGDVPGIAPPTREPFAQYIQGVQQNKRKRMLGVFETVGRLAKRRDAAAAKQARKTATTFTGNAQQQLENLLKEKTVFRTSTELIFLRQQEEQRVRLRTFGQREQALAAMRQSGSLGSAHPAVQRPAKPGAALAGLQRPALGGPAQTQQRPMGMPAGVAQNRVGNAPGPATPAGVSAAAQMARAAAQLRGGPSNNSSGATKNNTEAFQRSLGASAGNTPGKHAPMTPQQVALNNRGGGIAQASAEQLAAFNAVMAMGRQQMGVNNNRAQGSMPGNVAASPAAMAKAQQQMAGRMGADASSQAEMMARAASQMQGKPQGQWRAGNPSVADRQRMAAGGGMPQMSVDDMQRMQFNNQLMWIQQQAQQALASGRLAPAQAAFLQQQLRQASATGQVPPMLMGNAPGAGSPRAPPPNPPPPNPPPG